MPPPLPPKIVKKRSFKTKIEASMIPTVVVAIKAGLPMSLVGGLIGVTRNTILSWRELGSREDCDDPLLVEFALEVEKARAEASQAGVTLMQQHAAVDWKAAQALLQAADPETWSPQSRVKIDATVAPKAPSLDLSKLSDEELRVHRALLAKASPRELGDG